MTLERLFGSVERVELSLIPGHTHMDMTIAGHVVRIWPTPDPEHWHVSSNRGPDATSEPVTAGVIPALLQA